MAACLLRNVAVLTRSFRKGAVLSCYSTATEASAEEFKMSYLDDVTQNYKPQKLPNLYYPGIAVFSLNRQAARNAISKSLLMKLTEALEKVKYDNSLRALIVRSEVKGTFCAGYP